MHLILPKGMAEELATHSTQENSLETSLLYLRAERSQSHTLSTAMGENVLEQLHTCAAKRDLDAETLAGFALAIFTLADNPEILPVAPAPFQDASGKIRAALSLPENEAGYRPRQPGDSTQTRLASVILAIARARVPEDLTFRDMPPDGAVLASTQSALAYLVRCHASLQADRLLAPTRQAGQATERDITRALNLLSMAEETLPAIDPTYSQRRHQARFQHILKHVIPKKVSL